jgi:hypothetical protein
MTNRYRACGKQVLRDREHIADAASETYAQIIADALNGERNPVDRYGAEALDHDAIADKLAPSLEPGEEFFIVHEGQRYTGVVPSPELHRVTQHVDGSRTCICGRFWDRDEGDECPGAPR